MNERVKDLESSISSFESTIQNLEIEKSKKEKELKDLEQNITEMKFVLTKDNLEKEISEKQKEIEQLKLNYKSLLSNQEQVDILIKQYEAEKKKLKNN
ncbi:hypothetical protein V2P57_05195 [Mycoplasma mycoides subsp. mycoides]|uniref:Uncharacterized protein n=2 Tax=Mycoplasma mycoides subsp. mycoides TaxID=2103 RepID=Q6MRT8_MYCMS|nr:hypothetical protein [Mycoplasma mycoides]CAE77630.1 Hypothetical protein MSC_1024 [Mycoplasma mycoides subsp. mycoides SC str. PG1]ADK69101.1 conserved domain protein [Mycoplasma mycoides subsp. mycoides SC str. Gladysdale]AIZ55891.1 hypothetical protein mycmycITA_01079 [Mycoplasma mycoides subsp. mycoides]AMK56070.1 hypothetical protein MSCT144_01480 [Mycoplasma mycoides subsp. mycoides]KJQ45496.1 hypothetical protein TS60_1136 [Mycoplasma mycoides subsp. mycoides]